MENPDLKCPITHVIMTDPVICTDGYTYERNAIELWLVDHNTSPMTNLPLISKELIPNRAVKTLIESKTEPIEEPIKETSIEEKKINCFYKLVDTDKIYIKLNTPDEPIRKSCTIIFVIDVSGSMNELSSKDNDQGENDGLTKLDLVKHAMKTIIELLNHNDKIAIVTFSTNGTLLLNITTMNKIGKITANKIIDNIKADGTTNVWDGLRISFNIIKDITSNSNIDIMLLTDGHPTNEPNDIIKNINNFLEKNIINKSFSISCFGIGHDLKSELLVQISNYFEGTFGYIPDCSMITVIINYICNILCTYLHNCTLQIKYSDSTIQNEMIGSIMLQESRNILISKKECDINDISLLIGDKIIPFNNILGTDIIPFNNIPQFDEDITNTIIRYKIINCILNKFAISPDFDKIQELYKSIRENISTHKLNDIIKNEINNYLLDYDGKNNSNEGQIEIAYKNLDTWGKHFLLSLMIGYKTELRINFKNPGVQHFGGSLYNSIFDEADDIFCNIPAPIPSRKHKTPRYDYQTGGTYSYQNDNRSLSMRSYSNAYGGCFDGDGNIKIENGSTKKIKDLKKGDVIFSPIHNTVSTVICIIVTKINNIIPMCRINNMLITPYHPIKTDKWIFPNTISEIEEINIDCIYNIILSDYHIININDTNVVTLGHNIEEPIVKHPYFGTNKVIEDLKQMKGYEEGLIILENPKYIRENNIVIKLLL